MTKIAVTAFSVVKTLDVVEHVSLGFISSQVTSAVNALALQQAEEALNNSVVVTVATSTHAALDAVLVEFVAEVIARILGAAVGVM